MSTNFAKTLVWKHVNDFKLWRHKQRTPNTNVHLWPWTKSPPWIFLRSPLYHWSWNFWEMFSLISFLKNFSRMKCRWRKSYSQGGARGVPGGPLLRQNFAWPPHWPPKIFQVFFWKSYTDHWQLSLLQIWHLQWPPQMKMSRSSPGYSYQQQSNAAF